MQDLEISLTGDLLRNERNNYSNWPFAFWRELFQNSIDAGASVITINVTKKDEGMRPDGEPIRGILVSFKDNGSGMIAETLRNVYFKLGATTKKGQQTIGGHGKARMVTCFSHHAYGINTNYNKVFGYGTSVKFDENATYSPGCEIWVDVDTKGKWNEIDIVGQLRHFLSYAQLDCLIESNIEEFNHYKNWLYKRRHARDLSCGGVYVNKSGQKTGEAIVRVNGVPMFVKSHRGKAQVVIELDFERSREILVSNRDSLDGKYESELDDFLQEIAVDTTAALKDRSIKEERVIGRKNAKSITYRRRKEEKAKETDVASLTPTQLLEAARTAPVTHAELPPDHPLYQSLERQPSDRLRRAGLIPLVGEPETEEDRFAKDVPAFALYCDTDNAVMRKAMWLFNPENKEGKYFGSTKKKLAVLWAVAVEEAIQAWLDYTNRDNIAWLPGFLFSTDSEGKCKDTDEGTKCIYVRPVNLKGALDFRLNKVDDRVRLLVIACHEVAHLSERYHDEDYVKVLDALTMRVFARLPKVLKRMSRTIKNVR